MSDLDKLIEPMTVDEAREALYQGLAERGVNTTSWKEGAVLRSVVAVLAVILAALSTMQAMVARLGFLEFSNGSWLTVVARYVYGVERDLGSFASGPLVFDNSTGSVFSGAAGDLVVSSSVNGREYRNTEAYTIGALATGVVIQFEAVELGSDSNAGVGEIDTVVTALPGVTVTNAVTFIGADEEDDATLRLRCKQSLGALSPNGPSDAYSFFARGAKKTDGTSAGVNRVRTRPDGTGLVEVFVASPTGPVSGTVGDPSTALGAVDKAIQENVVPLCVRADVASATSTAEDVTYTIWIRSSAGLTETQALDQIEAAVIDFIENHPIGGEVINTDPGRLYVDSIAAAISQAMPDRSVVRLDIDEPAVDVDLAIDEVVSLGSLTGTVHFVAGEVL